MENNCVARFDILVCILKYHHKVETKYSWHSIRMFYIRLFCRFSDFEQMLKYVFDLLCNSNENVYDFVCELLKFLAML